MMYSNDGSKCYRGYKVDINGVDKMLETPFRITQYNSTAQQTMASKMTIKFNQHLSKTVSIQAQHYNLHVGGIYCN